MKRYSSDWHINHTNVLKYDNRPFETIQEHDIELVNIINKLVKADDQLYFLWDLFWKSKTYSFYVLSKIKCKNVFCILWNHDWHNQVKIIERLWRTNLWLMYIDKDAQVVLCHYPLEERYKWRHKDWCWFVHIHWHSHHNGSIKENRIDVWLNFSNLARPLELWEINLLFNRTNV